MLESGGVIKVGFLPLLVCDNYYALVTSLGLIWSYLVLFGLIWSYLVLNAFESLI